ncbi:MAG: hypothetical protein WD509_01795 [Candidatus Paceibacterota bacterium]
MENLFLLLFLASAAALIVGLIKPKLFENLLKEKATRKGTAAVFGIAAVVFLVLFGVAADTDTSSNGNTDDGTAVENVQADDPSPPAQPVAYEIVETEDQSRKALGNKRLSDYTSEEIALLPVNKKMRYRVVVSPDIKEAQVRPTVEKIISDITSRDNDIDEINLLLYSDKELADGAFDVAMATWAVGGDLGNVTPEIAENNDRSGYEISLTVRDNLEEYLRARGESEERLGFSEDERRQIFKEIVAAEDKARDEAEALYPIDISDPDYKQENLEKNFSKEQELADEYEAQVRVKYGITKEIQNAISTEAHQENWPFE